MIGAARNGASWKPRTSFQHTTDGLSNTLFVGEKHIYVSDLNKGGSGGGSADGNIYISDQTGWYESHSVRQTDHANGLGRGPQDNRANRWHTFGSWHPGICQFLLGDGSVRGISATIDLTTLSRLGDRRDGQTLGEF
jgi:hypothetical protein